MITGIFNLHHSVSSRVEDFVYPINGKILTFSQWRGCNQWQHHRGMGAFSLHPQIFSFPPVCLPTPKKNLKCVKIRPNLTVSAKKANFVCFICILKLIFPLKFFFSPSALQIRRATALPNVGSNINSLNYWAPFNQCCIKFAQLTHFWPLIG